MAGIGKLSNAPIFHVLCQIKFYSIANIEQYIDQISVQYRKLGYEDYKKTVVNGYEISDSEVKTTTKDVWSFTSVDEFSAFKLSDNSISFETSDYVDFDSFLERALDGFKVLLGEIEGLNHFRRAGLRLIDLIVPTNERDLTYYVRPSLLGYRFNSESDKKFKRLNKATMASALTEYGKVIVKSEVKSSGSLLPPDLMPTELAIAPKKKELVGQLDGKKDFMLLDTDHYQDEKGKFDVEVIKKLLDNLHDDLSDIFESCVTKEALKEWE